jgi:hypothetical protein
MTAALIVPLHQQVANWTHILAGVERQRTLPDVIYAVLDRPSRETVTTRDDKIDVDTLEHLAAVNARSPLADRIKVLVAPPPGFVGQPPTDPKQPLFLAGHSRNHGLTAALADGHDVLVMIDGDCIPEPSLMAGHRRKLGSGPAVLTLGRKGLEGHNWVDRREQTLKVAAARIFRPEGVVLNLEDLLSSGLTVWSANVGLNRAAVDRLRSLNRKYYDRDEVFSSDFSGRWGGEDAFLGVQCLYAGILICTVGDEGSGVRHIDHPRHATVSADESLSYFRTKLKGLKDAIRADPLTPDFFGLAGGGQD